MDDSDGLLDIIAIDSFSITTLINNGATFTWSSILYLERLISDAAAFSMSSGGQTEVMLVIASQNSIITLQSLALQFFFNVQLSLPTTVSLLKVADLNHDGIMDVVGRNPFYVQLIFVAALGSGGIQVFLGSLEAILGHSSPNLFYGIKSSGLQISNWNITCMEIADTNNDGQVEDSSSTEFLCY